MRHSENESKRGSHKVKTKWLGLSIETLADIHPRPGGVLLVGINPAPASVNLGHYYQGRLGKRLWARLRRVGLLDEEDEEWEDDAFARAGNGLTDVVKRPTASADEVSDEEVQAGIVLLRKKLKAWNPGIILFAFSKTAKALLGVGVDPGAGPQCEGIPTFLLTSPYARTEESARNERELRELLGSDESAPAGAPPGPGGDGFAPDRDAESATAGKDHAWSQRLTANDKERGQVRLPRPAKRFFPTNKARVPFVIRGRLLDASYDPPTGPDRERSAVLRVGREALFGIATGDRLRVSLRRDGAVVLEEKATSPGPTTSR